MFMEKCISALYGWDLQILDDLTWSILFICACLYVSWKEQQSNSGICAGMFENFQIKILTFNSTSIIFLIFIFGENKILTRCSCNFKAHA